MVRHIAHRRYNARVIVLSLIYAVCLLAAVYGFKHHLVNGVAAWIVALLPGLAIVGIFAAIGRYLVEEQDEYQRMLMVRQTIVATGFTLSIATIWGFLESFGLVGHVEAYYAAILWFAGLGLGACLNKLSFGGRAE